MSRLAGESSARVNDDATVLVVELSLSATPRDTPEPDGYMSLLLDRHGEIAKVYTFGRGDVHETHVERAFMFTIVEILPLDKASREAIQRFLDAEAQRKATEIQIMTEALRRHFGADCEIEVDADEGSVQAFLPDSAFIGADLNRVVADAQETLDKVRAEAYEADVRWARAGVRWR